MSKYLLCQPFFISRVDGSESDFNRVDGRESGFGRGGAECAKNVLDRINKIDRIGDDENPVNPVNPVKKTLHVFPRPEVGESSFSRVEGESVENVLDRINKIDRIKDDKNPDNPVNPVKKDCQHKAICGNKCGFVDCNGGGQVISPTQQLFPTT